MGVQRYARLLCELRNRWEAHLRSLVRPLSVSVERRSNLIRTPLWWRKLNIFQKQESKHLNMMKHSNTYYMGNFHCKALECWSLLPGCFQRHQGAVSQWNTPPRLWNMHFSSICFNCIPVPSLMTKERHYFSVWRSNLDFFKISFLFGLISFYFTLSYDRNMKQKEKEVYTHFVLSYSLNEHHAGVFYLIRWVDTFLVSWNIIPINPCLQTPWNIYWIIQYRF